MRPHLSNGSLAEQHQLDAAAGFGLRGCVRHCVGIMYESRARRDVCGDQATGALSCFVLFYKGAVCDG